jgi:gliding motility-associated-like protein
MVKRFRYWLFLSTLLIVQQAFASHIVGGELTYKHIGNFDYEIQLTVYRDCYNGIPEFDNPAMLDFFDAKNSFLFTEAMAWTGINDTIELERVSKCVEEPGDLCYEKTTYHKIVHLPPLVGGYQMAYKRCCWNVTVDNIINDGDVNGSAGITIYAKIPDAFEIPENGNPVFKNRTPPYNCQGTKLEFDHSAVDPDGDSLSYHIVTPLNGTDSTIHVPYPPEYLPVVYRPPFSLENVMGGSEPLEIDEETGWLTVKTDVAGQFVFGVEVREYRNGQYIGSTWRSYQLNTLICPDLTYAYIAVPSIFCERKKVDFVNESFGASRFIWNFGDPNDPGAGANTTHASYLYPDTGTYTVRLIAISDVDSVNCTDTIEKEVKLAADYNIIARFDEDECVNQLQFFADATTYPGFKNKWLWNFGDGNLSKLKEPTHLYENFGNYNIKVIGQIKKSHYGCVDSLEYTYHAFDRLPKVAISASKRSVYPRADSVKLNVTGLQHYQFSWKPKTGLNNPGIRNPLAKPQLTTTYQVTVTDTTGCSNQDTLTIFVNPYRCGESEIFIPNAFTPNGDGENDKMRVRGEDIKALYFAIYNRWGQVVYESSSVEMTTDNSKGWDGTFNGKELSPDVYVYYLRASCQEDNGVINNEFIKKGNITLIR